MLILPAECAKAILAFAPLFCKRVFTRVEILLVGAILAPAQRTVTACLRVMGLSDEKHFQNFHRVLNRVDWSPLKASRLLLQMVVARLVPDGPLVFGVDETVERRRGAKISALGIYRDAVRSSRKRLVKTSGLRWMSLMLMTSVPFSPRRWALPIMTVLCPSERYHQQHGRPHKKITQWARQIILLLRRWLPERDIIVVADSSYAALELLAAVRSSVTMITRLRFDAALYEPAPPRKPKQTGRPRKKGARMPLLSTLMNDPDQRWQRVLIRRWYSQSDRWVEMLSGTAVWNTSGIPAVPIRWVIVRDPDGGLTPQAFLSTTLTHTPEEIIGWYLDRWQMEVTFEESRQHLGIESQRQWSDKAIARTTPVVFALYSIVTLIALDLYDADSLSKRTAAWYYKGHFAFSDAIASVRESIWTHRSFSISHRKADTVKISRSLYDALISTIAYAC